MTIRIRYGEEQALVREEARRWLAEHCPASRVREHAQKDAEDAQAWKEVSELGWPGLCIEEEHGGAGLASTELAILAEETGRQLLPAPLLPHWLAALVVSHAGDEAQRATWLPRLATGELRACLAHVETDGAWAPADTRARVREGRIEAEKLHVWGAEGADLLVLPARCDEGLRFVCVPARAAGVEIVPERGLDPSRRQGRVRLASVELEGAAILEADAGFAWRKLLPRFQLAMAAEMAGGADALLELTAEYARTREQFGKAIGSFQAIKHPLVDVLIGVEKLRSLVYAAATAIDQESDESARLAASAKAQASETFPAAASRAIQFHGGIGFTEDCDAHLYLRRAQCSRPAFGDARELRRQIADAILPKTGAAGEGGER